LFEVVESNPQSFLDRWVNNNRRDTEVLIERAISMNIIRRSKNIYRYGSEVIGRIMQEAIDFLENPKNQDILLSVMKSVESKDSMGVLFEEPVTKDSVDEIQTPTEQSLLKAERKAVVPAWGDDVAALNEEEAMAFKTRPRRKGDTL
jgi:hypothetical protein